MLTSFAAEHIYPTTYSIITQDGTDKEHIDAKEELVRVLPPADGVIRFIHINIEGINPMQGYTGYKLLLNTFRNSRADIFGINELNLDTTQPLIRKS